MTSLFRVALPLLALFAVPLSARQSDAAAPMRISAELLGDSETAVATRLTFRFDAALDLGAARTPTLQGSILHDGKVVRNFRHLLRPDEVTMTQFVALLPAGAATIEARLIDFGDGSAPAILAKEALVLDVKPTGKSYEGSDEEDATAALAEGVLPESSGAVRILPPKRDLAPNLFIVDVEVKAPVKRIEFWADGKKIFTKNAPPYRAELDLGRLPRRVEVRAVGYDAKGRYVDADAWIVSERDAQIEAKIVRTETADGVSHVKVSVQNPQGSALGPVELFLDDRKVMIWTRPPYAIDLAAKSLERVRFLRASVKDASGYEASDILFLDGTTVDEEIEVNLVELPVSVTDEKGLVLTDLEQADFEILEDGKRQKITSFAFSDSLPLSIGLLIDHSGSMKPRIESTRKAALTFFSDILRAEDKAFFGGFSWQTQIVSPFTASVSTLKSQVSTMPEPEGATALYDAIVSGLYRFRAVQGRKALVIVSDGEDTASRVDYAEMLNYARASRVPLYFIGIDIGLGGGGRMKSLADETGGRAFFAKSAEGLPEAYEKLEAELRTQYLLRYYTEAGRKDRKYRAIEVRTSRKNAKTRTIRGFLP